MPTKKTSASSTRAKKTTAARGRSTAARKTTATRSRSAAAKKTTATRSRSAAAKKTTATRSRSTAARKTAGTRSRSTATRKTTATRSRSTASSRARSTASARASTLANEPEILKLIRKDHDEVKGLFKQFEKEVDSNPMRAGDLGRKILSELELHTKLEEQFVYPDLKNQDEDLYHEAEQEHHVADLLMKEVQAMSSSDPTYKAKMMVLRENVEHHIEEEQNEMFNKVAKVDQFRLQRMAEQWRSRKASGIPAGMMR
jgi:hypothetical protein